MTTSPASTEEAALRRAVELNPHDNTPRLIYADWLDENGRPEDARDQWLWVTRRRVCCEPGSDERRLEWATVAESVPVDEGELADVRREIVRLVHLVERYAGKEARARMMTTVAALRAREAALSRTLSLHRRAEFVRVQVELAGIKCGCFRDGTYMADDPFGYGPATIEMCCDCNRYRLRKRELELLDENWGPWIRGMGLVPGGWKLSTDGDDFHVWQDTPYHDGLRFQFASGFIGRITCDWQTWVQHGQHIPWHPEWTGECGRCGGDGRAHGADRPFEWSPDVNYDKCVVCGGTGRVPRLFTGVEHPVRELVLTTTPTVIEIFQLCQRHKLPPSPASLTQALAAEWPGLKVTLPGRGVPRVYNLDSLTREER